MVFSARSSRMSSLIALAALLMALVLQPAAESWGVTSYRVTYFANGGSGSMTSQMLSSSGANLKKNSFKKVDYRFAGWAKTSKGLVVYKDSARVKPTAAIKLYAQWLKNSVPAPTAPTVTGHTVGALLWADEFAGAAGTTISSASWTARYCGHENQNGGGTCHNSEPQWYIPGAIKLDGTAAGNAVITTKRTTVAPAGATCMVSQCYFTSGRFDTQGKVSFKYGYIETRIKMPAGGANWPAYWMLGDAMTSAGWPYAGEIDIAEQGGHQPWRNSAAVHYSVTDSPGECCGNHNYQYGERISNVNYSTDFHTYGLGWLPDRLEFYVDGVLFYTLNRADIGGAHWSFNDYFFVILNNATGSFGGDWDGWSESRMTIDYVRAWALDGQGSVVKH
jgi:beta-glucanase (GH16 family)